MNIERGPKKQRGFVIIDNALAQNNRLSFGARGLAEYLLSLPPGAKVDIRSLAADNPEGRSAIAGYMNELEKERYLVRTRIQGDRGRFVTKTTIYEEPQDPASLPATLPKPWSKAKAVNRTRLAVVPATSTESEFSQVGPNPAPPDFGGPDFGRPGPGGPAAGEAGVNPYGVKEPGGSTSSSPAREEAAVPVSSKGHEEGGGGGDAPQQKEEQNPAAVAFVDSLPYRGRLPGPRQRNHLIQRVGEALAAGWTENKLRVQLTEETDSAKSLAAVYRHRLDPDNLPDAPLLPSPRTAEQAAPRRQKAKCPECHRPLRNSTEDALCIDCREDVTA
ncbi:hypothetical protein [Streptomyces leeuwenhoekii]|uniref:Sle1_100 protein n=1 Tax=Streptomyces leeuwenhoekii TaxID=1437453 RepID=A0A0F7VPH9_STRLW|nr:hypothetical protein [Streptomyces leeuwenhoekii]CQR59267.1 sle1_100 [Streptomyces leeuwenhoekii]